MRVSIVVVVHPPYVQYLPTALGSIKSQLELVETVLVANGCYIAGALSLPTSTLAAAANAGIEKAKGRYVMRLDADDWLDPQLARLMADYLDAHPEVDAVWCDYLSAYGQGPVFPLDHAPQPELEHACGVLFRKSVWRALGGYNKELQYQEAFDFWLRFKQAGYQATRIPLPLYYYRRHPSSMSTNPERERVRQKILQKLQGTKH